MTGVNALNEGNARLAGVLGFGGWGLEFGMGFGVWGVHGAGGLRLNRRSEMSGCNGMNGLHGMNGMNGMSALSGIEMHRQQVMEAMSENWEIGEI